MPETRNQQRIREILGEKEPVQAKLENQGFLENAPEAVVATLAEAAVSEFLLLWLWHVVLRRSHIVSDFPGPFMIYDLAVESILAHTKIRREHKSCMEREVIGTE